MGEWDLEEALEDIKSNGLIRRKDYTYFDASDEAIVYEFSRIHGLETSIEVEFPLDWLKGYIHNGGTMIYYSGG
jgi:hypothetical protein